MMSENYQKNKVSKRVSVSLLEIEIELLKEDLRQAHITLEARWGKTKTTSCKLLDLQTIEKLFYMLPETLQPAKTEKIVFISGQEVLISVINLSFDKWNGEKPQDDYNKKALTGYKGELVFAELAILRILQNEGWKGVWIDSYGNKFRNGYWDEDSIVLLPESKQEILNEIYKIKGIPLIKSRISGRLF